MENKYVIKDIENFKERFLYLGELSIVKIWYTVFVVGSDYKPVALLCVPLTSTEHLLNHLHSWVSQ